MDAAKKANSAKTNTHPPKNLLSSSFLLPPRPPSSLLFSPHPIFILILHTHLSDFSSSGHRQTLREKHIQGIMSTKRHVFFLQILHSRVLRGNYVVIMPPIAWCCLDRGEYIPHVLVLPTYGTVQGEGRGRKIWANLTWGLGRAGPKKKKKKRVGKEGEEERLSLFLHWSRVWEGKGRGI